MIQLLARSPKNIALLLITVFYCDFVLAGYAKVKSYDQAVYDRDYNFSGNSSGAGENSSPLREDMASGEGMYQDVDTPPDSLKTDDGTKDEDFTSGPTQPETQAFQSVNSSNMVDLFTGDFSYNIPLMDVGGYPVNISYRSGISMDQEASWVGLGWNINPGTITRNMRGLPDDFNGGTDTIKKTASIRENKTVGVNLGANIELTGLILDPSIGLTGEVFHNNYKGWGLEKGLNVTLNAGQGSKGPLSGGLSITNNTQEGVTISPSLSLNFGDKEASEKGGLTGSFSTSSSYNSRTGIKSLNFSAGIREYIADSKNQTGNYSNMHSMGMDISPSIGFATTSYTPTITMPFTSTQVSFTLKGGLAIGVFHPHLSAGGYVSSQKIELQDTSMTLPAFGYLNYQNGANNPSVLLDFNREKEIPYHENPPVPNIAIPNYTYDVFSITGEGTGGMFRAYRSDIGFMYDHFIKTKDATDRFTVDLGAFPNMIHVGTDIYLNSAYTQNNAWLNDNPLKNTIAFRNSDSTFESVYFRNPGEKSINSTAFYNAVGGDDVVTAGLYQPGNSSPTILSTNFLNRYSNKKLVGTSLLSASNAVKTQRDKRTQVISYLNATEAGVAGLCRNIESYAYNHFIVDTCNGKADSVTFEARINSYRKANHISEIDVLNADGRRYVYGIPVYNFRQKDATFSVDSTRGDTLEGIVGYNPGSDNTALKNHHGNDWYFTSEEIPAYAHSFLLTGVLSPDYVDLTGDGVSDDDFGDAVKFNYTRVAGYSNPYKWRTPYGNYGEATYNQGLKTDTRDDKGSYVYGEKELWYLNSIQSKTMIATFTLDDRKDLLPMDEQGNKDVTNNSHNGSKLLKEIDLYSKADYLKNGATAIPIKTVHFEYDYELCTGINKNKNSSGSYGSYAYKDSGKLTLKKIWFTYNGNEKAVILNPYIFNYNSKNPVYNSKSYDRWGNYKDPLQNPNSASGHVITNDLYPYALQDSTDAAENAAAWTLDSIVLPSAGRIKVKYESDDYAYVQNRRAMQMFNVAGFASTADGTPKPWLYSKEGFVTTDNLFVIINSSKPLTSKQDIYYKYLEGVEKLYFKLNVLMPDDMWGSGSEYIPSYADIDTAYSGGGYGLINSGSFWVKMKGISLTGEDDGNYSPLAKAAIQFLRLNLSSKAFPNSEIGDNLDLEAFFKLLGQMGGNLFGSLTSFDQAARNANMAYFVDLDRTLVRLDNPDFKRFGGGLRVKQITIYDHWNAMTGQKESKYGQQYDYTTIKEINGVPTRISSGVASYEPMIGGEENPFHLPVRYVEKAAPAAPVTLGYVEEPLGESFFPAAGVGYSKVRVRSINTVNRKSANGYEESTFYTAYDFPTLVDNSMIDENTKKRYKPALSNFLRIDAKSYLTLSQGFKIELNDMHGKMKSQATYPETDSVNPISYTENFYKVDDQHAEFKHLSNNATVIDDKGNVDTTAVIGKDVEIMMDMREQQSLTAGANYEVNVDIFEIFILPIPVPSLIPVPEREEDRYRSVATTKVIQRYAVLDSVLHIEKGSRVSTKNLAYDSETGDVLLTRTSNEFNDPLFNFTYPAHWAYSGMGLAYKNIDAVFKGVTISNGVLEVNAKYPNIKNYFESGDEVLVSGRLKTGEQTPVNCDGVESGCNTNIYGSTYDTSIIWAVNARKISASSPVSITFIDKNGNAYSATDVSMKIIRSGKRNMAMSPVGSLTSLKSPLQIVSGHLKLVLDSTDNVIATGAAVFTDYWKVSDSKKSEAIDNSCTCGPLKVLFDYLIASGRLFIQASDNITVGSLVHDAQVAGYSINIDDCGILKTNSNRLFYATTTSTIGTSYSAQIGNGLVKITSSTGLRSIHFYELKSTSCSGGSKVYYKDYDSVIVRYQVFNSNTFSKEFRYDNCSTAEIPLTADSLSTSSCFYALKGHVYLGSGLSLYSSVGCGGPDTMYCSNDTTSIYLAIQTCEDCLTYACYSVITDTTVNPYATGIFGNWRTDRAFVYYGQRAEKDPSTQTDIRRNGVINGFAPFWSFSDTYLQPSLDSSRWVWNAQTTLFNKKGFELENKDPLGRYNSGRYGYNNSLPVSVTQNSKYREQFFDGFEDYFYKDQNCTQALCASGREGDFTQSDANLDSVIRHSGKFSLKIAAHDSARINIPVAELLKDTSSQKIREDFDLGIDTVAIPKGHGLIPTAFNLSSQPITYGGYIQVNSTGLYTVTGLISGIASAGTYTFSLVVNGSSINNVSGADSAYEQVFLKAGIPYTITVLASGSGANYFTSAPVFKWQKCDLDKAVVPTSNLYGVVSDTVGSMVVNNDCSRLTGIHTDSTSLLPSFSPLQGSKMWLSAWVRENRDCLCQSYTGNQIKLVFSDYTGAGIDSVIAKPSGTIIEGWQRYDYTFTIPSNAASITYKLMATDTTAVNFDDLRLHPFNANMKSFVYNPITLRLMAELDENNYATFYEYDDDGTLIRVKKETQRGIKTIKETRSYLTKYSGQ